jgi:multiple sugar transport system substrate-binding protein
MATTTAPTQLSFAIFGGGRPHVNSIEAEVQAFADAHPEITIRRTHTSFYDTPVPYSSLQRRYFAEHPDIVSGYIGGSLRPDAEAGKFLDLGDLWQELGLNTSVPASVVDMAGVNGKQYWIPTVAQWNPIFYNADAFAAANLEPPETWEDVVSACKPLRAVGVDRPIAQAGTPGWTPPAARWFSTLDLAINGPDFHEQLARGQVAWTDPRIRAVFTEWSRLFNDCYGDPVVQRYAEPISELASGSAAMDNLGEWIYESSPLSYTGADPLGFFTIDPVDETLPRSDIAVVFGLAIPTDAADPDAAKELIRWLVSPDALERSYASLHRVVIDSRVDPGYPPRQTKGLELIGAADRLIEVWEFLAVEPQADIGLKLFTSFLSDPAGLDGYLAEAENARAEAFGSIAGTGS